MKLGGRIAAAIEVLTDVLERHTPTTDALRDWGKAHRFAGSKDRSFIGNIVHDALRQKSSIGWRMGDDTPRALALGTIGHIWEYSVEDLEAAFADDVHAPQPLSDEEKAAIETGVDINLAPDWVRADIPEWIWPSFEGNFAEEAVAEGQAMAMRPPLDIRVNTIKMSRDEALIKLEQFGAVKGALSPVALRVPAPSKEGRLPNVQIEEIYQTGGIEIQDEGSQLASLLVAPKPGEQILDYCAGGGGKTLALAGAMGNEGKLYAYDIDKRRLAPIYQRALRNGVTMIDVRQPPVRNLSDLKGKMDRVLIDAPCTGAGTWRRKPDAKWRLSPETLDIRMREQSKVLEQAAEYVKEGGYLIYVTCSLLAEENEAQVYDFLEKNKAYAILSAGEVWEDLFGVDGNKPWSTDGCTVTMTPASTDTDGFFFAVMEKVPADQRFTPELD